jgi:hypothetical protein
LHDGRDARSPLERSSHPWDAELMKRLPVGELKPQTERDVFEVEKAGRIGIHVVAWAAALSACFWLIFAWWNPTAAP